MSALSNVLETELLEHILNNANIADVGDSTGLRGSASAGNLYVSLHTSSPGEAGDQEDNECAYTSYARVAVARDGSGWTVTNDTAVPQANIDFPAATGGSETATHFGIGTASSGAGKLILYGAISPNIAISTGVTPRLTTATAITAA